MSPQTRVTQPNSLRESTAHRTCGHSEFLLESNGSTSVHHEDEKLTNVIDSLYFWSCLEQEIIQAKQCNCWILAQFDANAKLDSEIHEMSDNGRLLSEMVQRQNLTILNNSPLCQGKITRHRTTKDREEKAILDFALGCDNLAKHLEKMLVDEERLFTLTKYVTTKGRKRKVASDHNPLYCKFNLPFRKQIGHSNRKEIFNFKDEESLETFRMETEKTSKFTDLFENDDKFEVKTQKFQRCLKQSVQKCFSKIRIRRKKKITEVGQLLELKSKLQIFLLSTDCEKSKRKAKNKIVKIEEKIQELSANRNAKLVENHIEMMKTNGKFAQTGMWKLKKKLHPGKQLDPPMAKHDSKGNVITAPPLIRKLYLDTYTDRLRNREMNPEFSVVFRMKSELWRLRLEFLKSIKSPGWNMDDLNKVLKSMKNNKSRDPHGFVNEIFKPGVIGTNLKAGILCLINGIKEEFYFPFFIQWANITTIWKKKKSRLSLESDR